MKKIFINFLARNIIYFKSKVKNNRGVALLLALIVSAIILLIGTAFGILVTNEIVSTGKMDDSERALLLAEAGLSDVLFQRLQHAETACFPFNNGNGQFDENKNPVNDTSIPAGKMAEFKSDDGTTIINCPVTGAWSTTFTGEDSKKIFQPQIYNPFAEELLTGQLGHEPEFGGYDGNHADKDCGAGRKCPDKYSPIGVWPAESDGTPLCRDFATGKAFPCSGTESTKSKEKYTTGMFVGCNEPTEEQLEACNGDPQMGDAFGCIRYCPLISIVSTGELVKKKDRIRRSVKMDIYLPPPAVIDKYVDLTYAKYVDVEAPVHINRWKLGKAHPLSGGIDPDKWWAFFYSLEAFWEFVKDFGFGDWSWVDQIWQIPTVVGNLIDPPPLISLSEEYQEKELCFEVFGNEFCINSSVIHIPWRLPLPNVLWNKWEDRLKELEDLAENAVVLPVRKLDYGLPNPPGDDYPGWRNDEEEDPEGLLDLKCPANAGPRRIHNCEKESNYTQWGGGSRGELFDLFDPAATVEAGACSSNYYITDSECQFDKAGKRINQSLDMSKEKQTSCLFNLTPGLGDILKGCYLNCAAFAAICNCSDSDFGGGLCEKCGDIFCKERPRFKFMGKHQVRSGSKVFVDGTILMGMRTPIHSCYQGGSDFACLACPSSGQGCCVELPFGLGCFIPAFSIGVPHWHTGEFQVKGEVLVTGKLYLADKIDINGGAIYAKENVIKDQSSGIDVSLDVKALFCSIFQWLTGINLCSISDWIICDIPLIGELICDLLQGFVDLIWMGIDALIESWLGFPIDLEDIPLTNNKIIDWVDVPLVARGDPTNPTRNPGTIYTQKSFIYAPPDSEILVTLLNQLFGLFGLTNFLKFKEAADPFVLENGAALIAKEDILFAGGHSRIDLSVLKEGTYQNPNRYNSGIGFAIAGRDMKIRGDIGEIEYDQDLFGNWGYKYPGGGGLTDAPSETAHGLFYASRIFGRQGCVSPTDWDMFTEGEGALGDPAIAQAKCWWDAYPLKSWDNDNYFRLAGNLFAGQVGSIAGTQMKFYPDSRVRAEAVKQGYFDKLYFSGQPLDWMEVSVPNIAE